MKIERILAAAMAGVLAAGLLAGCGEKTKDKEVKGNTDTGDQKEQINKENISADEGTVQGRFLEQEIALPVREGEKGIGAYEKDGIIYLYTCVENGESAENYYSYQFQDGKWSEPMEAAGLDHVANDMHISIDRLSLGADKNVYGLGIPLTEDLPYGGHILKMEDEGAWTDVTPEPLLKVGENGYTAMIPDMDVLADGTLCIFNGDTDQVEAYRDGAKVFSADTQSSVSDYQKAIGVSSNTLAVTGRDGTSLEFYSAGDFASKGSFSMEQKDNMDRMGNLIGGIDGNWYVLDTAGIHRFQENGDILETVMDGSYGKMGTTANMVYSFFQGAEDDFYVLYWNYDSSTSSFARYSYQADAPEVNQILTIYGLKQNQTVEQAVNAFQSKHPEVKVEYSYSVGEREKATTDQIRTLNAELLNGEGTDVLILDGLPVSSYIEKGVLADISDMTKELKEMGVLMDVIGNTAVDKDGIYGLPARIGVPIAYGPKEACKLLESWDEIWNYLQANPQDGYFTDTFHDITAKTMVAAMYPELMEGNALDQGKMTQLITGWQQICENLNTKDFESLTGYETGQMDGANYYFHSGGMGMVDTTHVTVDEFQGLFSMIGPCDEMIAAGIEPQTIRGYYVPYAIAGVNAASGQQDLGKEFIKFLFSDEVQTIQTGDGYPVTVSALGSLADYVETDTAKEMSMGTSLKNPQTGEEVMRTYHYPDRATVESYIALIQTLNQPFLPNTVLLDAVMEEMEKCYEGSQTPEGAAQAIAQKMDTYLSE